MDILRGCLQLRFGTRALFTMSVIALTLSLVAATSSNGQPSGASTQQTKLVLFDLKVSETEFHIGTPDAGMARVTLPDGMRLEVVPTVLSDTLGVRVWGVTFDPASGQDKRVEVAYVTLSRGETTSFQAGTFSAAIRWTGVKEGGGAAAQEGCTQCCMTCGETTVCACIVEAPCGRCCCDVCCAIQGRVNPVPHF